MQFRFAHRALESQEQPVIEMAWIVEAVLVQNQSVRQRANLQQTMPVRAVARQARDLQAHHDPCFAQANIGDQTLKAFALAGGGAGLALIMIDHYDSIFRPTQRHRALAQGVLSLGALGIFKHLAQGGLANIEISGALEMFSGELGFGIHNAAVG